MLKTTRDAINAIMATDVSIDPVERQAIMDTLRKGCKTTVETKPDRVVRRQETAARFGVSPKTVDLWVRTGYLTPVKFPGKDRAVGFRESEVSRLITGEQVAV